MALFARTIKTIENKGRIIPIPFSETAVSPDNVSDRYTITPSKIKFNMMLRRPNTNWVCLLLYLKIVINDSKADSKNKPLIQTISNAITLDLEALVQIEKTKLSPPETMAASAKYNV